MGIHFTLAMGALSEPIEEQLQRQGLTLGSAGHAAYLQRRAMEISSLTIHGLLSEAESVQARKRLMKKIRASVQPLPAGEPNQGESNV